MQKAQVSQAARFAASLSLSFLCFSVPPFSRPSPWPFACFAATATADGQSTEERAVFGALQQRCNSLPIAVARRASGSQESNRRTANGPIGAGRWQAGWPAGWLRSVECQHFQNITLNNTNNKKKNHSNNNKNNNNETASLNSALSWSG